MPAPKILSEGQWKLLLDYMEADPTFAKGITGARNGQEAKVENNARWKRLASKLNNVGTGCIKNYRQWREYWNNVKYTVRKKTCTIRNQMRGVTNDEPLHRYFLFTKNEKRVLRSLGMPIPGEEWMKIKSPPDSQTPDASQSSPDVSLPQSEISPSATPSLDIPMRHIKSEPDSTRMASTLHWVPITMEQKDNQAAPPAPEWIRDIEERRIAVEEKSAQALQGIQANTEFCVSALQGILFAQESLNKTMQGIQAALEASARALERRN